jgi:DNA-directed RNA polymerase subunit K
MVNSVPQVAVPLTAAALPAAPSGSYVTENTSERAPAEATYTRFERARILGARALQVSLGAPILTDVPPDAIDPVLIAELEFAVGVIPITVRRGVAR